MTDEMILHMIKLAISVSTAGVVRVVVGVPKFLIGTQAGASSACKRSQNPSIRTSAERI
jgi:hypothetical protein